MESTQAWLQRSIFPCGSFYSQGMPAAHQLWTARTSGSDRGWHHEWPRHRPYTLGMSFLTRTNRGQQQSWRAAQRRVCQDGGFHYGAFTWPYLSHIHINPRLILIGPVTFLPLVPLWASYKLYPGLIPPKCLFQAPNPPGCLFRATIPPRCLFQAPIPPGCLFLIMSWRREHIVNSFTLPSVLMSQPGFHMPLRFSKRNSSRIACDRVSHVEVTHPSECFTLNEWLPCFSQPTLYKTPDLRNIHRPINEVCLFFYFSTLRQGTKSICSSFVQ